MAKSEFRVSEVVGHLKRRAPFDLAETWDNVGLLVGDPNDVVKGVVCAVNLGQESLEVAERVGASLIVCHHPPIFKPLSRVTASSHPFLYRALRNGMSVVALHTNFDLSSEELSRAMARDLGAQYVGPLAPRGGGQNSDHPASIGMGKFVTYLPEENLDQMRAALSTAGAGKIGHYSSCSFSWAGQGTFIGGEGSAPVVGQKGKLEKVNEMRLEMVFPWAIREKIIEAARKAHPYEEMAYDVIELAQAARVVGYGFVADFEKPLAMEEFSACVKKYFDVKTITGVAMANPNGYVKRMAFSPGSGSGFVSAAIAKGVDAYVCGEVGYHHMLDAKREGMHLLILGHSYSEKYFVETTAQWITKDTDGAVGVEKVYEVVDVHF
jgi:dinuclear metal center YbgI/SA1388 family protein